MLFPDEYFINSQVWVVMKICFYRFCLINLYLKLNTNKRQIKQTIANLLGKHIPY